MPKLPGIPNVDKSKSKGIGTGARLTLVTSINSVVLSVWAKLIYPMLTKPTPIEYRLFIFLAKNNSRLSFVPIR